MSISPIVSTEVRRVELPLATEFTIARGSNATVENFIVTLTDAEGRIGVGGSAPSQYYGETPKTVAETLPNLLQVAESIENPLAQQQLQDELEATAPDQAAARAAISIACHDLAAKQREEPLYQQWGLDPSRDPDTSYTISIDSPSAMANQARKRYEAGFSILKVKLGTNNDAQRLRAIREAVPDARIRVDANGDWTAQTALERLEALEAVEVEFLEQPVPADDLAGLERVRNGASIPIAADESCITAGDVPAIGDAVDIVVVKLMKCGGIRPALAQIETAHSHGLSVMLGCMIESNASIAAALHLSPLVEYCDLDGSLLLERDPVRGIPSTMNSFDMTALSVGTGAKL